MNGDECKNTSDHDCGDDCKNTEKKPCPCSVCDGHETIEQIVVRQQEMFKKQGWYADCVAEGDVTPFGFNYHTHGFEETFGCPNIQFVLPVEPRILHNLTHELVKMLKDGLKITDGMFLDKLIKGYQVKFVKATECDREVLRIILPDKNGCLTADAEGPFGEQYKDLPTK